MCIRDRICSFMGHIFFVSAHLFQGKGQSLRYLPGQGTPHCCVVMLYMGEGSKREQCHLLVSRRAFSHFLCYPQANEREIFILRIVRLASPKSVGQVYRLETLEGYLLLS